MKRNTFIVILILLIFFVISFLTNILAPLNPDIITSFHLSVGLAGFLPFAFFVAYGVMSIPAGIMIEKYSEKTVLLLAFGSAFIGAFLFGLIPGFFVYMLSLFLIGIGMAMLQVVINPLLRQAGGEESFYFNSVLAQLCFGGASFLSPMLYSYLVENVHSGNTSLLIRICDSLVPENLKWVSLYWIFAFIAFLMIVMIRFIKFPTVELKDDEKIEMGNAFKVLLGNKYVILFFIGIFAYVGTEQGISYWISKFLQTYHGVDPAKEGAEVISYFWGLLTVGCLLGLLLLKLFDSRRVLIIFSTGAIISLLCALFGTVEMSLYAFAITGFFASVMWSVIFSLALNSVPSHHGTFSGILCTGIVGGAIVPLIIGGLAEMVGLRYAMLFLFITLGYIFSIGFWARPIVTNKTIYQLKKPLNTKMKETDGEVIGIDLGGTNVRAGLVINNKISNIISSRIASAGSVEDVMKDIFNVTDQVMNLSVQGIGIGVPGVVDVKKGVVYDVQNIKSWKEVTLKDYMEDRYKVPVSVNNDANCFALGEKYFGKARDVDSFVGLIVGTGLGAGVIINNKLFAGANCGAGEFGMVHYLDSIYEDYCSGQYFKNKYQTNGEELFNRCEEGDKEALRIYNEMGEHLGNAIKMILFTYDPQKIIFGGSVRHAYKYFQESMWNSINKFAFPKSLNNFSIELSDLKDSAVLGAAALYYDSQ